MDRDFLDTNILVYADDSDAGVKRETARAILADGVAKGTLVLSTQVLQEYFVIATRKLGVDPVAARRKVELLTTLDVVRIEIPMVLDAIDLTRLHSVSLWDALIVRAAQVAGCRRVLTEDLQDGQSFGSVRITNPFG